jgi:hypothetical protein
LTGSIDGLAVTVVVTVGLPVTVELTVSFVAFLKRPFVIHQW